VINHRDLDRLTAALSLEDKVRLLSGETAWQTFGVPAIGLRSIVVSDGPIGVRGTRWDERDTSLALPSPTALAATWDEALVERLGRVLAGEARRKHVDVLLAPTLNLHRSPLGGRHFECFSEDPVLTARTGAAYIRGVQSGGVAATAKHYVANDSETERMTLDARVDEVALREVYLAPFEAAVRAGAWVVMSAYNGVNGHRMSESPLLAEPLKGEWGFDGVVVSDWGAVRSVGESANAPQDLAMPGPHTPWATGLLAAVRAGDVPLAIIDDKIRRLLRLAARVGALEGFPTAAAEPAPQADPRALLREAVAASTVLLRNDGATLPLEGFTSVAVLGPSAAAARIQGGGSAGVFPESVISPLDGIREALRGRAEVRHAPGARIDDRPTPILQADGRDPVTGEPGTRVRVLAGGTELYTERRLTGRILEPGEATEDATVEVSTRFTPPVSGAWRIGVAGWGHLTLAVDGATVLDEDVPLDTDDPAVIHLAPAYRFATLDLTAGEPVDLAATRIPVPGSGQVIVLAADPPTLDAAAELAAAVDLARTSDVAIVVVGTTDEIESEGFDRVTLDLPGNQDTLVRAVAAANLRTVVVVNSGGPVAMPWRDEVPAVLLSWFPGQEAGDGLADVLFGAVEPGGRLPTTWPADQQDLPVHDTRPVDGVLSYVEGAEIGYRAWLRAGGKPAYWFGHGLGYTTWEYGPVTVDGGRVCVAVRNTGDRPGREVVQVYVSSADRPTARLAGYTAVKAAPGEKVEATIELPDRAFERWTAGGWQREQGPYTIRVGVPGSDQWCQGSWTGSVGTDPASSRSSNGTSASG
jgi:beta-glucosidase